MRILLVEDSERLSTAVSDGLRKSGYAVDVTADGESGLRLAESVDYDVILLDVLLPGIDGLTVLTRLRAAGSPSSILMLTARDKIEDRVRGLRGGADDYLVKPFALEELLARVEVLGRRRHGVKTPQIQVEDLVINTAAKTVHRSGNRIELTPREYALLEYLVLRRGVVVSRTEIEAHLYEDRVELMSNVVDAAVYGLRKRLDSPGKASLIQTRRGMGYVLGAAADPEPM